MTNSAQISHIPPKNLIWVGEAFLLIKEYILARNKEQESIALFWLRLKILLQEYIKNSNKETIMNLREIETKIGWRRK